MKHIALIAACTFLASAVALAASGEKLIVPPYPGDPAWKNITNKGNAEQQLLEWIPASQSEADIHDILTEQIFFAAKGADPATFVTNFLNGAAQACDHVRVNGPKRNSENGYPVAYAQVYCAHQKGTSLDVDIFLKAIAGRDALYVVQREFRHPMQPGAVPGVIDVPKGQEAAMNARLALQVAADRFLTAGVQLCPPPGKGAACPAKPKP